MEVRKLFYLTPFSLIQNPNLTFGVHPVLLHDLLHLVANFSANDLGGNIENLIEDLEQRTIRHGDLGADEDDAVRGVWRSVLDSDLGIGGLLKRLYEHTGLVDDRGDKRSRESCRVQNSSCHHQNGQGWSLVWPSKWNTLLFAFWFILQRKLLFLLPITLLLQRIYIQGFTQNTESENKREKKPIPFKYGFVKLSLYTVQLQWFFE